MVKLQILSLQSCRKNDFPCFVGLFKFQEHLLQNIPERKKATTLKFNVIMLLKVCSSSFSAVTTCTFDSLTDDRSLIKTKFNRLINSVCFRVRSIDKIN